MIPLTDQEEGLITPLKQLFYYPDPNTDISTAIEHLKNTYNGQQWPKIMSSALQEISYEQARRRDYISGELRVRNMTKKQLDALINGIARDPASLRALANQINPLASFSTDAVSDETMNQAKIFNTVSTSISWYQTSLAKIRIVPLFTVLSKLTPEGAADLLAKIKNFSQASFQSYQQNGPANIVLPESIATILEKGGLSSLIEDPSDLEDIITSLNMIARILSALAANKELPNPLPLDEVTTSVAYWVASVEPTEFIQDET